jgi:hypothetical protein
VNRDLDESIHRQVTNGFQADTNFTNLHEWDYAWSNPFSIRVNQWNSCRQIYFSRRKGFWDERKAFDTNFTNCRQLNSRKLCAVNRDRLSKEHRSWNLSRIRGMVAVRWHYHAGKNYPLNCVQASLTCFRLHVRIPIPQPKTQNSPLKTKTRFVTPDILPTKQRVAIFVHGCFWH